MARTWTIDAQVRNLVLSSWGTSVYPTWLCDARLDELLRGRPGLECPGMHTLRALTLMRRLLSVKVRLGSLDFPCMSGRLLTTLSLSQRAGQRTLLLSNIQIIPPPFQCDGTGRSLSRTNVHVGILFLAKSSPPKAGSLGITAGVCAVMYAVRKISVSVELPLCLLPPKDIERRRHKQSAPSSYQRSWYTLMFESPIIPQAPPSPL